MANGKSCTENVYEHVCNVHARHPTAREKEREHTQQEIEWNTQHAVHTTSKSRVMG